MLFIKKYWYFSVILGLLLYIITVPKKVYKVYPKETKKLETTIVNLNDSIELLNYEKKLLSLDDKKKVKVDTVFVNLPSKTKETIVIERNEVIKEIDCTEYYNDPKRDSLWTKGLSKKNNP
jgi:hypothetical protein